MLRTVLIDAGPLIALFDKDDAYHERIVQFIKNGNYKFMSTVTVLTEVMYMLDFYIAVQIDFLRWIADEGVVIYEIKQKNIARMMELIKKYSDRPMDFADATLMIAAEETGIREIISIDEDFDIYRLFGKMKLKNIFNYRSVR